jgi:hypothetical protein
MNVILNELYDDVWTEARSRLQLVTGDIPAIVMGAKPAKAFEQVTGYRVPPDSTNSTVEFDTGPNAANNIPREYRPSLAIQLTAFELRCSASDRCLQAQRQSVKNLKRNPKM